MFHHIKFPHCNWMIQFHLVGEKVTASIPDRRGFRLTLADLFTQQQPILDNIHPNIQVIKSYYKEP
jgi:hypothetical protein